MENVMVDLETLGTRPGCAILSIGAVRFGASKLSDESGSRGLGAEFYTVVNRASCAQVHLREERGTLDWWSRQALEARVILAQVDDLDLAVPISDALMAFARFLEPDAPCVWGNGADFDNPILAMAYAACRMPQPWKPYNGRCYRTLKSLRPDVKLVRTGTYHNALDDARTQAEHAVRLLAAIG